MALPWLQIVQLVPSILDVSRELLKKNKGPQPSPERKQAELVSQMAEQLAVMTKLIVELRSRVFWLTGTAIVALIVAVVALFVP
jgi:hypothetical protein